LLSNGVAVTYAVTDTNADTLADTLTASAGGREVFTLKVNADGSWAFDLKDQLDHVAGNGENTALRTVGGGSVDTIDFSEMIVVTDADGDSVRNLLTAGDFSITVQDDIPVITNSTDLMYANQLNPAVGGTGFFSYSLGADERSSYSPTSSDLSISMGGAVGTANIGAPAVTWVSESATSAQYSFSFSY